MTTRKSLIATRRQISGLFAALLTAPLAFTAQAAQTNTNWVGTATHTHPIENALQRNLLASGEPLQVVVALKMRNQSQLASFVGELTRAGSPAYGQWLSSAQFSERHAPSAAQVAAVVEHLRRAGFINIEVAPNRLLVTADGTAGTARNAFHTELAHFDLDGRKVFANIKDVLVPQALDGIVLSVLGLQSVDELHTMAKLAELATPAATVSPQATPAKRGFNPLEFQKAYGVGSTPTASTTTVGIITEGSLSATYSDLRAYEAANALPQIPLLTTQVGATSTDTSGTIEWDLDSQSIQAMAGGTVQQMIFYNTTSLSNANITAAFNKAVVDNAAKIVNVSLGECETSAQSDGMVAADDQIFQTAIAQGQIFSVSSGDSGSHECRVLFKTANNAKQSYPASSPYVVAVGGTSLLVDAAGNYYSESAWSGSGGGPSVVEPQPSWQNGVVSGTRRGVPDVALAADPNTGAKIIVNGKSTQVGGTSLASPLFVGLYARIESANGNSLGFPNPGFYQYFPSNPALIHDVTTGNNGGSNTYNAGPGWDYPTGFGSPIVGNLAAFIPMHLPF